MSIYNLYRMYILLRLLRLFTFTRLYISIVKFSRWAATCSVKINIILIHPKKLSQLKQTVSITSAIAVFLYATQHYATLRQSISRMCVSWQRSAECTIRWSRGKAAFLSCQKRCVGGCWIVGFVWNVILRDLAYLNFIFVRPLTTPICTTERANYSGRDCFSSFNTRSWTVKKKMVNGYIKAADKKKTSDPLLWRKTTRETRRRVPYKWRQICRKSLLLFALLKTLKCC